MPTKPVPTALPCDEDPAEHPLDFGADRAPRVVDVTPGLDGLPHDPVHAVEWPTRDNPSVHQAISLVMRAVGEVSKNQRNNDQNYNFRGIDAFYNAYHGPMSDVGLVMVPEVLNVSTDERRTSTGKAMYHVMLTVRYRFIGPDGSELGIVVVGEGQDTQDKAVTKALSAAHKYAMQQVFMPPIEEQEADHGSEDTEYQGWQPRPPAGPQKATNDQYRAIITAMEVLTDEQKADVSAFVKSSGFGSMKEKTLLASEAEAILEHIGAFPF